jgi:hypothetical protein
MHNNRIPAMAKEKSRKKVKVLPSSAVSSKQSNFNMLKRKDMM